MLITSRTLLIPQHDIQNQNLHKQEKNLMSYLIVVIHKQGSNSNYHNAVLYPLSRIIKIYKQGRTAKYLMQHMTFLFKEHL